MGLAITAHLAYLGNSALTASFTAIVSLVLVASTTEPLRPNKKASKRQTVGASLPHLVAFGGREWPHAISSLALRQRHDFDSSIALLSDASLFNQSPVW